MYITKIKYVYNVNIGTTDRYIKKRANLYTKKWFVYSVSTGTTDRCNNKYTPLILP